MLNKYWLFTVDTEWDRRSKRKGLTTENLTALPRLQALCDDEGVRPCYYTAYEAAISPVFESFATTLLAEGKGEVGTHLHPWTTPPFSAQERDAPKAASFPNELPLVEFERKLEQLQTALVRRFGRQYSYRAGRFGFIPAHAEILSRLGYLSDSSVTPHLSWQGHSGLTANAGPDFRAYDANPFVWQSKEGELLELPLTIVRRYKPLSKVLRPWASHLSYRLGLGQFWLRPLPDNLVFLEDMVTAVARLGLPLVNVMIHSNELNPTTNPYFNTPERVALLFEALQRLFKRLDQAGYKNVTPQEYAELSIKNASLPRRLASSLD